MPASGWPRLLGAAPVALLAAASVLAGPRWTVQPTPNPTGPDSISTLVSVSCWSPSGCIAVGQHDDKAGTETTLAERWNGARWTTQRTPLTFTGFGAVSCPGPRDCIAVGGTGPVLAERWDGRRWAVLSPVTPRDGTQASLDAVSCVSARDCVAVGGYYYHGRRQHQLAERWDGRRWRLSRSPGPRGDGAFFAVSCSSGRACTAVGDYTSGSRQYPFAERWNGRAWTGQPVPSPAGHAMLFGVSCPAARSCEAVGAVTAGAATAAMAVRWNGRRWALAALAAPGGLGPSGDQLTGIWCRSASRCVAVGQYDHGGLATLTLAERWAGGRWVIQPTPAVLHGDTEFWSVSCPRGTCTAVGDRTGGVRDTLTLAESGPS